MVRGEGKKARLPPKIHQVRCRWCPGMREDCAICSSETPANGPGAAPGPPASDTVKRDPADASKSPDGESASLIDVAVDRDLFRLPGGGVADERGHTVELADVSGAATITKPGDDRGDAFPVSFWCAVVPDFVVGKGFSVSHSVEKRDSPPRHGHRPLTILMT